MEAEELRERVRLEHESKQFLLANLKSANEELAFANEDRELYKVQASKLRKRLKVTKQSFTEASGEVNEEAISFTSSLVPSSSGFSQMRKDTVS